MESEPENPDSGLILKTFTHAGSLIRVFTVCSVGKLRIQAFFVQTGKTLIRLC